MTRLQQAAYDAQLAANMPASRLATATLITGNGVISIKDCARYLVAVQRTAWFEAAFPAHDHAIVVTGGRGISHADARQHTVKIGTSDRQHITQCEQACLHELAHIVSSDHAADGQPREPALGRYSSKGHHHAWRANFVFIVRMAIGKQPAARLRREFNQWGLPTR